MNEMNEKNIYRCIVRYTDPKYSQSISNLFLWQKTPEGAMKDTKLVMADEFRKTGIKPVEFSVEIMLSSIGEAKLYAQKMNANRSSDRMVN